jgi:hypothetical protein
MIGPHGAADADDIAAAVEEALDTTINQLRVLGLGGAVSALGFASLSMALIGLYSPDMLSLRQQHCKTDTAANTVSLSRLEYNALLGRHHVYVARAFSLFIMH